MDYDDEFLKSIPHFLRRHDDILSNPAPAKASGAPRNGCDADQASGMAGQAPLPPRRAASRAQAAAPTAAGEGGIAPASAATPPAPAASRPGSWPHDGRGKGSGETRFGAALRKQRAARAPQDSAPQSVADQAPDDADAAFQVTLPRRVIRQIRMRAAEEGTTHRAIILRSLRAAGLSVPEGVDIDRRTLAARSRHQDAPRA
ncbi:MAG: hypothetical protein ACE5KF_11325, partial [Kiloniellaceae bacterium]